MDSELVKLALLVAADAVRLNLMFCSLALQFPGAVAYLATHRPPKGP